MLFRHGDVLIQQVAQLPAPLEKLQHHILAHGEVTGHCHRVEQGELYLGPDGLFLKVSEPTQVVHEEHAPIPLRPGFYRVWRQREYSPQEIRVVRD